jgi:hypothetical protein
MCSGQSCDHGIEIDEIAAPHVDGADAQTRGVRIDTIEIDQLFERRLKTISIVGAGGLRGSRQMQPWRRKSRCEKPGRAADEGEIGAHLVLPLPYGIALRQ